jgi:tetratricopeptide (TPR) repeat protein/O-antigen ligase
MYVLSREVKKKASGSGYSKRDIKKTADIKKTTGTSQWELSHSLAFWGLALLLFLSPYFRGLYFPAEQEKALIFTVGVFWLAWLWKWSRQNYSFISNHLDCFVLAFPAVYLISAFQAVNYGPAVDKVLQSTLYLLVYWLASRLIRNEKDIMNILRVIYISAIGVALAGLAAATGIIYITKGIVDGRICSVLQYPNTLGSYLVAIMFIGLYLWRRAGKAETCRSFAGIKNMNQYLYAAANFLLFAVFIGTKSQGSFLVFLFAIVLFFIVIPKGDRLPVFIHFAIFSLFSSITIWFFLRAVADGKMALAWLWFLIGLIFVLAAQTLYSFSENKGMPGWISGHKNILLFAFCFLLLIIACFIGAGVYANTHGDIVRMGIDKIRLRNAAERMYFYKDALKMFRERPLLGWGGGGWEEAYRAYQGYFYNSDKVHGYYFQVLVETGIIGILALLGIWASFLHLAHRLFHQAKSDDAKKFLLCVIMISAVSLGLHAAIDFDLSLSAVALVIWTMFGLARGIGIHAGAEIEEKKIKKHVPLNYVVPVSVLAVSISVVALTVSLAMAGNYSAQVGTKVQSQSVNQSIELLKKASAYNPFNADYHSNIARLYQYQGNYEEAIIQAEKAVELSKYSAVRYTELANLFYYREDGSAEAVKNAEKALSAAPFQIERYEFLAKIYFNAGYKDLLAGNRDMAKLYFEKASVVPDRINDITATLNDIEKRLWKDSPMIAPTAAVKLNVGKSQYFLGRWPEAKQNLEDALADTEVGGEATLWLAVLRKQQGRSQEAQDLLAELEESDPENAKNFDGILKIEILH